MSDNVIADLCSRDLRYKQRHTTPNLRLTLGVDAFALQKGAHLKAFGVSVSI